MVDKNQAMINYLMNCSTIKDNELFFNFAEPEDNNKQFITNTTDRVLNKSYIDGSVLRRYTFTIIDYRSIIYQAVVNSPLYPNENVTDLLNVQGIIDWIDEQNDNYNFPNFGDDCKVDSIEALTDTPNLNGVDSESTSKLAKYSIAIRVTYLDTSKVLWNK